MHDHPPPWPPPAPLGPDPAGLNRAQKWGVGVVVSSTALTLLLYLRLLLTVPKKRHVPWRERLHLWMNVSRLGMLIRLLHAISSLAQEARSHALGPAKSGLDPLLELAINGGGSARGFAALTLHTLATGGDAAAVAALASSDAAIEWFVSQLRGDSDAVRARRRLSASARTSVASSEAELA